ncbi:MAG: GNAT family N-acetyltransferase [Betaproteobacteria bacterium]|nr:GNAT family N-acetyltransferase [Betaproteobacteria bacterium]MDE2004721.1 GNAT family N-acetyltransferase [Betaproteobacteria bacterium]MDE2211007.1 GNAT family N-acetyltransferase [Betaproteobacteria bacterium]
MQASTGTHITAATVHDRSIRALAREDLDAVVAIDAASRGRSRHGYFGHRLAAALREPGLHAQFAAVDDKGLSGYVLARVLAGEFGRSAPALRLEAIGVRGDVQRRGVGTRLMDVLAGWARRHGIREVLTQAAWNDHRIVQWLDAAGFSLAPNHVVDAFVHGGTYAPARDDPVAMPGAAGSAQEINYATGTGNDFERLARDTAEVRSMVPEDLADIARIDRAIIGRDRTAYIEAKLNETIVDSAIRVSLTAHDRGVVMGFLMARTDLGDFGRTEAVAVIDTIGVDPDCAHRGVGHALVSQLFANLGALGTERLESVVAPHDLGLLAFLYRVGFTPSQRLAFVRKLA